MRKILLLFIIIAALPAGLIAQDESGGGGGGGFFVGAKAGYGMVKFKSVTAMKDFAEATWDNLAYGILGGYKLNGNLSIQLEVVYSQYGASRIIPTYIYSAESPLLQPYNPDSEVDHVNMDIYDIDIPVLVKYTMSGSGFSPYAYVGADWGINVLATTTIVQAFTAGEVYYREFKDDITDRIKYNEFSPVIGLGAKMDMGSLSLFGDLRYKHGFKNISNVDNGLGFKNSSIWLSAGAFFNF